MTPELPPAAEIDRLLLPYREVIAGDFDGYRNHCQRVYHFSLALSPGLDPTLLAVAAAFHDLGIWTADTFDYLEPSRTLARNYLQSISRPELIDPVEAMIEEHHLLHRYDGPHGQSVEVFRQADLLDVSLGRIRHGLSRTQVRTIRKSFANRGFHRALVRLFFRELWRHPRHPLPMLKW